MGTLLSAMFLFYVYVVSQQNLDTSERATAATHIDAITTAKFYDLKGLEYSLGGIDTKLILVNFWGTWCAPCIQEFPLLEKVYAGVQDRCVFLMISDEDTATIQEFVDQNSYTFTYLRSDENLRKSIGVFPTTLLLDSKGNILFSQRGAFHENSKNDLLNAIEQHSSR